ncbi:MULTISPECIES: GNAT family N-acetyltransferase [Aliiglaciecola]|uniref:GNAT family N-acetyltransferase n=1 Tax=Aliiglaciecola TaxID=1406885 RepID=UPI001C08AF99|nr:MULTISPECIES: GNAT family N-acetyltransferase [Aliiglaciecola]MBU2877498.1 GNAT family N-acetyltransferase [Aliiglaciecola lipolytica]MDO6711078.1 GNAT family N-acetyltransferase [Aliiglaciecola sp. 2_MG-2023]MDO6751992.1 GNAT family N-acetyltransferase [Aliiglaciecola sp. 1_MG-2023]
MEIKLEKPISAQLIALLKAHHQEMFEHSPPESVHALDESKFNADDLTFWGLWQQDELAGCGALKVLSAKHAEIKSMRTSKAFLRQGIAAKILTHLIREAKQRGYHRLSLETGSMEFFAPARALYAKNGFIECSPFADYVEDPHSVCMTLDIRRVDSEPHKS